MWILWLGLAGLFVLLELHFGTFYMLLFAASALCSMLSSLFMHQLLWQGIVFMVAAFLAYLFLLPILRKLRIFQTAPKDVDVFTAKNLVGKTGIVVRNITQQSSGLVKVDSDIWSAVADEPIFADERVMILDVKVTKLFVKKVDQGGV